MFSKEARRVEEAKEKKDRISEPGFFLLASSSSWSPNSAIVALGQYLHQ
jgi:hypothetical protein